MNNIRKISTQYKITSGFWLMLLFLFALLSKANFSAVQHNVTDSLSGRHDTGKNHLISISGAESCASVLQKIQDNDADDFDAVVFESHGLNYIVHSGISCSYSTQKLQYTTYKVPLYDLYCNWRHHVI